MRVEEKRKIKKAIELLMSDEGFNDGIDILCGLVGLSLPKQRSLMASANLDILVSVGGLVYELESAANKNGATIYNICHRNAGWAIQWHEQKKQGESDNWKDGLVIHRYYETLEAMVKGEFLRLGESPIMPAPDIGRRNN